MKQVNFRVSEEMHRQLKLKSIQEGVPLQFAMTTIAQKWLEGKFKLSMQIKAEPEVFKPTPIPQAPEEVQTPYEPLRTTEYGDLIETASPTDWLDKL